jgi:hypothetical protein
VREMEDSTFYTNIKRVQEDIYTGKAAINEIRKRCGLSEIEDGDILITKRISDNKKD